MKSYHYIIILILITSFLVGCKPTGRAYQLVSDLNERFRVERTIASDTITLKFYEDSIAPLQNDEVIFIADNINSDCSILSSSIEPVIKDDKKILWIFGKGISSPNDLNVKEILPNELTYTVSCTLSSNDFLGKWRLVNEQIEGIIKNYVPPDMTECSDNTDNDNDGKIDLDDPDCDKSEDDNESSPPTPLQCSDGIDNDADNLIDMLDPGCEALVDNNESNNYLPACSDGLDNDADQVIDMRDPGCGSPGDPDELDSPSSIPACSDGIDNDADDLIDMMDPGCGAPIDNDESNSDSPACSDGIDNDNDGFIDMADSACNSLNDNSELYDESIPDNPLDGEDTDNDGIPDIYDPDQGGTTNPDNDLDNDGIYNYEDNDIDGDGIPNDQDEDDDNDSILDIYDIDDDNDGIPDSPTGETPQIGCTSDWAECQFDSDCPCPEDFCDDREGDTIQNDYVYYPDHGICLLPDCFCSGDAAEGGPCQPGYVLNDMVNCPYDSSELDGDVGGGIDGGMIPSHMGTACSDGLDNDGDGSIDLNDPGCTSGDDDSEENTDMPPMGEGMP